MEEEIKEVEATNIKELTKPVFESEIKAEIKTIGAIEDNIQEVQEFAQKLNEYYSKIVFTEDTLKEAKTEKAEVNKMKSKVADYRKQIVNKYNEPLQKFIDGAKVTETILTETYNVINSQISFYEQEQKEKKLKELRNYFNELCQKEQIDFVSIEQTDINITLSASMKSLKEKIKIFVDKIVDNLKLIKMQKYFDEILVDYKKHLDVTKAIADVNNRHIELDKMKEEQEAKKEQELNDETMLNKIDEVLKVPKIEKVDEKEKSPVESGQVQILEAPFLIRTTSKECLKEMKEVAKKYDAELIFLTKDGGVYHE